MDQILGTLSGGDVDLYRIGLGAGLFTAGTHSVPCCNTSFPDTQLFLFDSTGMGIVANDDRGNVASQGSFISANLAAGIYYLAVSTFNLDPYSVSGNIFPDFFNCCQHPISINSGPGGGDPLSFWANGPAGGGTAQGGAYRITLNQETVPEPTSVLLLGAGLAALPFFRRKRGRT